MTVCIAARAGNQIIGAVDRMLTSGDVEFEPSAGSKLHQLTNSICVMGAGDAALQAEITTRVSRIVIDRIASEPARWWMVGDVADLYVDQYNIVKKRRSESAVLAQLGLNSESLIANQGLMSDTIVRDLLKEIINFDMPDVSAIVTGIDPGGSHIFVVSANESRCLDTVGFAAIGSGGRHATSQFMVARHAWNAELGETLMLSFSAKRRAEVAPGVGRDTDMVIAGPQLGSMIKIGDHVIQKLEEEHRKLQQSETAAFTRAKVRMKNFVEEITKAASAAGNASADKQASPPVPDGDASVDGGT